MTLPGETLMLLHKTALTTAVLLRIAVVAASQHQNFPDD